MEHTEEQKNFNKFIENLYTKWQRGNLVVILYTAISKDELSKISDIKGYLNSCIVDCVYIKSLINREEVQIYSWNLPKLKITTRKDTMTIAKNRVKIKIQF